MSNQVPHVGLPPKMMLPTAIGPVEAEHLWSALHDIAALHARRALSYSGKEDPLAMIDAAISSGAAVELLAKSFLAKVNNHLIASNADANTTLALAGYPRLSDGLPSVRTIGGAGATSALQKLGDANCGPWKAAADRTLARRDAAIHMGFVAPSNQADVASDLVEGIRGIFEVGTSMLRRPEMTGLWGTFWAEQVTLADFFLAKITDARATQFAMMLAEARHRYGVIRDTLKGTGVQDLLESHSPTCRGGEFAEHWLCPACGSSGWVVLTPVHRAEMLDSDAPLSSSGWWSITDTPVRFECGVCGLEIDDSALLALFGLVERESRRQQMTPAEAFLWTEDPDESE